MSLKKRMVATAFAFAVTAVFAVQNGKTGDIAAARVFEVDVRFVKAGRAALAAVGYFDSNQGDAAVLQERLLARGDVETVCVMPITMRSGDETVRKIVTEYIYPTDYDVKLLQKNTGEGVSAVAEPKSFTMREVGAIVRVTPTLTDGGDDPVNLTFHAAFVEEPLWKNYGAKAQRKEGAAAYDLVMEQPFFPCVCFDSNVSIRRGGTLVFGGATDSREQNEDRFVLVFVTMRPADTAGEKCVSTDTRKDVPGSMVELDVRYISADRKTLSEAGYFDTNRVQAAVLQKRLMARRDAKLLSAPRIVVHPGAEASLKGVMEYIYPTDFEVVQAVSEQAVGTNVIERSDSTGVAVKPKSFTMREVGTIFTVKPTWANGGDLIDLELQAAFVDDPTWKDYGVKVQGKEGAAAYDLPMEQPFFHRMLDIDTHVTMKPGTTYVFGGGSDRGKGDEGRRILVFVTPRRLCR